MSVHLSSDLHPTGRWRHRLWRGRLVLQIEETGVEYVGRPFGVDADSVPSRWRDATVSDVTLTSRMPAPEIVS